MNTYLLFLGIWCLCGFVAWIIEFVRIIKEGYKTSLTVGDIASLFFAGVFGLLYLLPVLIDLTKINANSVIFS